MRSEAIVISTHEHTDFRADEMSPRNLGSQINNSRCFTRIDKTNIIIYELDIIIFAHLKTHSVLDHAYIYEIWQHC